MFSFILNICFNTKSQTISLNESKFFRLITSVFLNFLVNVFFVFRSVKTCPSHNCGKMLRDSTKSKRTGNELLPFLWYDGNPEMLLLTAICVQSTLKVLERKISLRFCTKVFLRLFDQFQIATNCPLQFLVALLKTFKENLAKKHVIASIPR